MKREVLWTCRSSDPGQAQDTIIKVPVSEDVGQTVVVVVLLRVQLQELLHADVSEAERVGPVPLICSGVDLEQGVVKCCVEMRTWKQEVTS